MTFGKAYNTTITESWQVVQLEGACLTCMKPWYPTDRMTWRGVQACTPTHEVETGGAEVHGHLDYRESLTPAWNA